MARKIREKAGPWWLGIDPGQAGFFCAYDGTGLVSSTPIPYLDRHPDIKRVIKILRVFKRAGVVFAFLEKQSVHAKQGVVSGGTTMFGYAVLKTALLAVGIPFEDGDPEDWKRGMKIPKPGGKLHPLPKKPPKGSGKAVVAAWIVEKKIVEKKRSQQRNALTKRRKELAYAKAQQLSPETDFRASARCRVPADGKFEAFLMSVYARRIHRGETSE